MQFVSDRWYENYTRAVMGLSGLLLTASLLNKFLEPAGKYLSGIGLSELTIYLPAVHLIYVLVFYRVVRQRANVYAASTFSNFLFILSIVTLVHGTGQLQSWFQLAWMILVFFSGIFGPYTVLGFCFLTIMYAIQLMTEAGKVSMDLYTLQVVALTCLVGGLGYLLWKRFYINQENSQIAKLSGQLKSNKQQSEILINSISDGIMLIGTDGKINLMNPAAANMTEWPVAEAVGIEASAVLKLLHEDGTELPPDDNPITYVLSKQQSMEQILQLVGRNQKSITVSFVVSPVIVPKTKQFAGAVALIRDISEARAEEKRRADFISTASHEMRTPVAAIEGYLALALNDRVSQIDAKARSYLEKAHSSTQHLGKLFQDLLTSAKAEDGRLVSHPAVVEMGSYLEQLAESLKFAAEKRGLLVDFVVGADSPNTTDSNTRVIKPLYYTHVDPDRLREVVTNLFDNAVKYTEKGKITIGLTGNAEVVQVSVKDTGPGIPAEDLPHLFQKFYRVDNSVTRTIGGTGLGLFICRKIVELYKGRIWVDSELGKGSTFYINLPRLSTMRAEELMKTEAAGAGLPEIVNNSEPVSTSQTASPAAAVSSIPT